MTPGVGAVAGAGGAESVGVGDAANFLGGEKGSCGVDAHRPLEGAATELTGENRSLGVDGDDPHGSLLTGLGVAVNPPNSSESSSNPLSTCKGRSQALYL